MEIPHIDHYLYIISSGNTMTIPIQIILYNYAVWITSPKKTIDKYTAHPTMAE